jgi:hypothetical protein
VIHSHHHASTGKKWKNKGCQRSAQKDTRACHSGFGEKTKEQPPPPPPQRKIKTKQLVTRIKKRTKLLKVGLHMKYIITTIRERKRAENGVLKGCVHMTPERHHLELIHT